VARTELADIAGAREAFAAAGQSHVFEFWDDLDDAGREDLGEQARRLAPHVAGLCEEQRRATERLENPAERALSPAPAISLPEYGGRADDFEAAAESGFEMLRAGRVAVFVVAGGQGTRLGHSGPKGGLRVGPISGRSLFEIQAQKIRGLARRAGCPIPWYVMTSASTDRDTRRLFAESGNFGVADDDVFIFQQAMVPAADFTGKWLLERPDRIFESPNGHGGSLMALASSGALDDMASRGVDRLFYYQVDNPLVRMADPAYLGFHEEAGAEMSCKVVRKRDPMEKVGVVAQADGLMEMVEYTELADQERYQRDADGQLAFWAGNIAIHFFNTDFIRRVANDAAALLPFHPSAKRIPHATRASSGEIEIAQPSEANGYKFERFVFDALPVAERVCVLEASAREEFAPIKNARGPDSLTTAQAAMVALYRGWIEGSGIEAPDEDHLIEIDHSQVDSAAEVAKLGASELADLNEIVRVATGMDS